MARKETGREVASAKRNNGSLTERWSELLGERIESERPEGFQTVEEIAQAMNLSSIRTQQKLFALFKTKKISRIKGRNDEGRVCWFYGVR